MPVWKEVESNNAFNSAVLATKTEQIVAAPARVDHFNRLLVQNRDSMPIAILLDNQTTEGKYYEVQAYGGILIIEPEDGIVFKQIVQKNLSAVDTQTAENILFRFAKAERVG
jgi:hypothetical protein